MRRNSVHRVQALGLGAALVGWSFVGPRLPNRARSAAQAGLAGLLDLVAAAPLGLLPPRLWDGVRLGTAAGAAAATGVLAVTSVPAVRRSMAERKLPAAVSSWLAVQIPLGTVWAEEAAFRAALAAVAGRAYGASGGRLLQAVAFGLSHIVDARATGAPVLPTMLATGGAGWIFGWLADRSGSLSAPMLAHLAINESAAAAALIIQRRSQG
ncbi:Rv0804 family intramembrane glutamic endopeptidase [Candidatus Mycobacterium methanotrophicum]|uniref:CPBP family intramembrane metalloprotease n=1 Tax=Candidatus Mycobacterium methanotrophicum TaxID=2943498 RepID=A0ABY4QIK4_9MYCO|nr:CPBP family intramembrane glutamic endopeptidase [Candidatus Mycobacterium methanotrophicum]UQX10694.1 CPBP family intramembrane metalloprotease [Candidatus Mycobacterium methanotrophicum]